MKDQTEKRVLALMRIRREREGGCNSLEEVLDSNRSHFAVICDCLKSLCKKSG